MHTKSYLEKKREELETRYAVSEDSEDEVDEEEDCEEEDNEEEDSEDEDNEDEYSEDKDSEDEEEKDEESGDSSSSDSPTELLDKSAKDRSGPEPYKTRDVKGQLWQLVPHRDRTWKMVSAIFRITCYSIHKFPPYNSQ